MNQPKIKSGKLYVGHSFICGTNVVIDVAEEVIIGDRCILPNNAHLCGRRIEIGNDFYGYSWEWKRLDIGRGRRSDEYSTLKIGDRCTFHDNKIDLARSVTIGNDVGLSPEVAIYTHGYWQSILEGYPARFANVTVGDNTIIGFRSVLLAGADIGPNSVIGAQSVVTGKLEGGDMYGGNPARMIKKHYIPDPIEREGMLNQLLNEYIDTLEWRGMGSHKILTQYPVIRFRQVIINSETYECVGNEDEFTDDLRDFMFRRGIRIYTQRPFRHLGRHSHDQ